VITVLLRQVGTIKKLKFDIDFASLAIKAELRRNLVSKYPIKKIEIKEKNFYFVAKKVWYDDTVQRLNVDGRVSY
jgi:topoisomerase-4 subunit A